METLKCIRTRKSIRNFLPQYITDEELDTILYAGSIAPIGMGAYKSILLTSVKDKNLINKITETTKIKTNNDKAFPFYNAPQLIVISSEAAQHVNSEYYNTSAIAENILLAATDLGVGTVYVLSCIEVMQQDDEILKLLNLPTGHVPYVVIALGYPSVPLTEEKSMDKKIKVNYIG